MSLPERAAETGAWLFRWRSYLPLVLVAVIVPAFHEFAYPRGSHTYDLLWDMVCLLVALLGLAIRGYAIGYAPKGTSGRNTRGQVADTLNVTGIYSVVRNPLYLGNFVMALGVTMFPRVWWLPVIYTLAFWLYYERIIAAEESFLRGRFGREYEGYLARVPAFVPRFGLWRPNELPFSLRNVLKREYSGFFGVIAAFTALEVAGDFVVEREIVLDPLWAAIFVFGLVVYIVLRTLKKKTRLLHVDGR